MNKLLALADRVEKLTGPDREVMYEAFDACMSRRESSREGVIAWSREWLAFQKLVNAEAWLNAAMMILPDEWDHMEVYRPDYQTLGWTVHVMYNANLKRTQFLGFAQSHELALVAASLRARAHGGGEG